MAVPISIAPHRPTVPTMGSNTNTVQRFRPRVTVEAIQYDGTNDMAIAEWTGCDLTRSTGPDGELYITLPGGRGMRVNVGEWIISGTTGMYFTRAPEQFAKDYVEEPDPAPELTPQQRIAAAQLRAMTAQRDAAEAQRALKREIDSLSEAEREAVSRLSPNAQRMVHAFRGDQP